MPVKRDVATKAVLREREKLFAYIWLIVRDKHIAEDVFQDLVLLVFSKCDEIADEQRLGGWLRNAARFKSLEAIRARKAQPCLLDHHTLDLLDADWSHTDSMDSLQMQEALGRCLLKLNAYAQRIVELRYRDGLRSGAIAEKLGKTPAGIYRALMRIHDRLAGCIEHQLAREG
jgi:RNA polymerase sigma-70 factor (ECF subfamily)